MMRAYAYYNLQQQILPVLRDRPPASMSARAGTGLFELSFCFVNGRTEADNADLWNRLHFPGRAMKF